MTLKIAYDLALILAYILILGSLTIFASQSTKNLDQRPLPLAINLLFELTAKIVRGGIYLE